MDMYLVVGAQCRAPLALEKLIFSVGSTTRILAADFGSCAPKRLSLIGSAGGMQSERQAHTATMPAARQVEAGVRCAAHGGLCLTGAGGIAGCSSRSCCTV